MVDPKCFMYRTGQVKRPSIIGTQSQPRLSLQNDNISLHDSYSSKISHLNTHHLLKQRKILEANQATNITLSQCLRQRQNKIQSPPKPDSTDVQLAQSHRYSDTVLEQTKESPKSRRSLDYGCRYRANGDERKVGESKQLFVSSSTTPEDTKRRASQCLLSVMLHSRDELGTYYFNQFPGDLIWRQPMVPRFDNDVDLDLHNNDLIDLYLNSREDFKCGRPKCTVQLPSKTPPRRNGSMAKLRRHSYSGDQKFLVRQNREFIRDSLRSIDLMEKHAGYSQDLLKEQKPITMLRKSKSAPVNTFKSLHQRETFSGPHLPIPLSRSFLESLPSLEADRNASKSIRLSRQKMQNEMTALKDRVDEFATLTQQERQRRLSLQQGISGSDPKTIRPSTSSTSRSYTRT